MCKKVDKTGEVEARFPKLAVKSVGDRMSIRLVARTSNPSMVAFICRRESRQTLSTRLGTIERGRCMLECSAGHSKLLLASLYLFFAQAPLLPL